MRACVVGTALVAVGLYGPVFAAPSVEVSFADHRWFADVGDRSRPAASLDDVRYVFEAAARRSLSDGDQLSIRVLDIDWSGQRELTRSGQRDVRVQRDPHGTRFVFRYRILKDGRASEGEATLTAGVRDSAPGRCGPTEPMCSEQRMIEDWLTRTAAQPAAR